MDLPVYYELEKTMVTGITAYIQEIIHIVDMDGAYIPDTAVQLEKTAEKPQYKIDKILTKNLDGIYNRNEAKRGCLNSVC